MSRTVKVTVETTILFRLEDGVDINEVLDNMDYTFECSENDPGAEVIRTEITDSKVEEL